MSRFPFSVGRSDTDLCLADPGVWDTHFRIELSPGHRFFLQIGEGRIVTIDGLDVPTKNKDIRDGAMIGCGSVNLRFQLSPTAPRDLRIQALALWVVLGLVLLLELGILTVGMR
jgi:hypothetical protein